MHSTVMTTTRVGAALRIWTAALMALIAAWLAAPWPAAASVDGAQAFIRTLGDRAVKVMNGRDDRREGLERLIQDGLDIPGLGRYALGSFLRQSNPKKVEEYLSLFRDYAIMAYPNLMGKLNLRRFEILSAKAIDPDSSYVVTRIGYGEKETIEVGWYVREAPKGHYKVQDVQLEGYSLRSFQRAKFEKILRDRWIDGLIKVMQAWVANGREEPYLQ